MVKGSRYSSVTPWINHEVRPCAAPDVEAQPDGTITLRWEAIGETVLLSRDELAELVREASDILMTA